MHVIQADHPEQTNHLTTLTTLTTLTNIFTRNCIVCNKLSFTIDKFRIRFDSWGLLLLVYKAGNLSYFTSQLVIFLPKV